MATLDSFLPYVTLHVSGVPVPVMRQEIQSALLAFCSRSRAWKGKGTMNVVAGTAEYSITAPAEADVSLVEEVYYNGVLLQPEAMDALKKRYENWMTKTGTPLYYTQFDQDHITLVPSPTVSITGGLLYRVCYKPDRTATTVPDAIFSQYAEIIASGAIARLMAVPGLPCFNPAGAQAQAALFDQGIVQIATSADKSFTRAPRRTVARFM